MTAEEQENNDEDLLIDRDEYLANGVHIGTKSQHKDMDPYIFHVKKNQLAVLNVEETDKQIRKVAKILADYEPEDVLVVGRKEEALIPLTEFAEVNGFQRIAGRFMPGTLTNPQSENFTEPELIITINPTLDKQAIEEAEDSNIPVVSITDSGNRLEKIDHPIPGNNKATNSVATILYLLTKEIAKEKELDLDTELQDFKPEESEEEETE